MTICYRMHWWVAQHQMCQNRALTAMVLTLNPWLLGCKDNLNPGLSYVNQIYQISYKEWCKCSNNDVIKTICLCIPYWCVNVKTKDTIKLRHCDFPIHQKKAVKHTIFLLCHLYISQTIRLVPYLGTLYIKHTHTLTYDSVSHS